MISRKRIIISASIACIALIGACNRTSPPIATPTVSGVDQVKTAVALTQQSYTTTPSATESVPASPVPTAFLPTMTIVAPIKETATVNIPAPENVTPSPTECLDSVDFVDDINYPDGSIVVLGETFTKTWKLKNTGSCTWGKEYTIVHISGEPFGVTEEVPLRDITIEPEAVFTASIALEAPSIDGTYKANFKLKNPAGLVFGIGLPHDPFYVLVEVVTPTETPTLTPTP